MDEAQAERDDEAVSRFIERFALDLTQAGMPRMPARVFAGLLATDSGTLTAAELAHRLQVSPAAISGAVRYLMQLNMASREREPGSRRDHYRVHDDLWYEVISRRDDVVTRWQQTLRQGVAALGADTTAGLRMVETLAFFEFLQDEVHVIQQKWRDRKAELQAEWADRVPGSQPS